MAGSKLTGNAEARVVTPGRPARRGVPRRGRGPGRSSGGVVKARPLTKQAKLMLAYLQRPGATLTAAEAWAMKMGMRAGARAWELRQAGHNIVTDFVRVETASGWATVASYRLIPPPAAPPADGTLFGPVDLPPSTSGDVA